MNFHKTALQYSTAQIKAHKKYSIFRRFTECQKFHGGGVQTHSTFRKVIALILTAVVVLSLTGCPSPTDDTPKGNNQTPPEPPEPQIPTSPIGTKAAGDALEVGDIVFNDGTATPYSKIASRDPAECTAAEKAAAIAVIFKVGDGTEGNKTLGMGIFCVNNGLSWCIETAAGNDFEFSTDVYVTDGSRVLYQMAQELDEATGKTNDTGVNKVNGTFILPPVSTQSGSDYLKLKTNYPAFEWAYYYGKNSGHHITPDSTYENGWYLPTAQEMYSMNDDWTLIKNALNSAGCTDFDLYGGSNQTASSCNTSANYQIKDDMGWGMISTSRTDTAGVCAIRVFN